MVDSNISRHVEDAASTPLIRRRMIGDLAEGMTDGTYKKRNRDWGPVDSATADARRELFHEHYDIGEEPVKVLPDTTIA